MLSMKLRSKEY